MNIDQINYDLSIFNFIGIRKHLFGNKKYYCYVLPDFIVMGIVRKYIIEKLFFRKTKTLIPNTE